MDAPHLGLTSGAIVSNIVSTIGLYEFDFAASIRGHATLLSNEQISAEEVTKRMSGLFDDTPGNGWRASPNSYISLDVMFDEPVFVNEISIRTSPAEYFTYFVYDADTIEYFNHGILVESNVDSTYHRLNFGSKYKYGAYIKGFSFFCQSQSLDNLFVVGKKASDILGADFSKVWQAEERIKALPSSTDNQVVTSNYPVGQNQTTFKPLTMSITTNPWANVEPLFDIDYDSCLSEDVSSIQIQFNYPIALKSVDLIFRDQLESISNGPPVSISVIPSTSGIPNHFAKMSETSIYNYYRTRYYPTVTSYFFVYINQGAIKNPICGLTISGAVIQDESQRVKDAAVPSSTPLVSTTVLVDTTIAPEMDVPVDTTIAPGTLAETKVDVPVDTTIAPGTLAETKVDVPVANVEIEKKSNKMKTDPKTLIKSHKDRTAREKRKKEMTTKTKELKNKEDNKTAKTSRKQKSSTRREVGKKEQTVKLKTPHLKEGKRNRPIDSLKNKTARQKSNPAKLKLKGVRAKQA